MAAAAPQDDPVPYLRRARHWKQRFRARGPFRFRRTMQWDETVYQPGDPVPLEVAAAAGVTKLRRWWESEAIELLDFDPALPHEGLRSLPSDPIGEPVPEAEPEPAPEPEPATALLDRTVQCGKGWYELHLTDGSVEKVRGRKAFDERVADFHVRARLLEKEGNDAPA